MNDNVWGENETNGGCQVKFNQEESVEIVKCR